MPRLSFLASFPLLIQHGEGGGGSRRQVAQHIQKVGVLTPESILPQPHSCCFKQIRPSLVSFRLWSAPFHFNFYQTLTNKTPIADN